MDKKLNCIFCNHCGQMLVGKVPKYCPICGRKLIRLMDIPRCYPAEPPDAKRLRYAA